MGIRYYKPTTSSRRGGSVNLHSEVTRHEPEKRLLRPLPQRAGRNAQGKITAKGRGGGHKRRYRVIDFRRLKDDLPASVLAIEYDPNRTCHIALVEYPDGERRYVLAPQGLRVGEQLLSSEQAVEPKAGNCMPLRHIPTGLTVHNVEFEPR
jgi:large subunit ribosomal protein L2